MKKYIGAFKQLIKFNLVGIVNTAVDFFVFTLLTQALHFVYLPAKVISYACGILNSYILNTSWTFKREKKRTGREVLLFTLVNLVSLGVSLGVMAFCRNVLHIESDFYCNLIATPVSMLINFTGNKLLVFPNQKGGNSRVQ